MAKDERLTDMNEEERVRAIKRGEARGRAGIGQPGVESAAGRDRTTDELPTNFGTNVNSADVDAVAPPKGSVKGTRVGDAGDTTGAPKQD